MAQDLPQAGPEGEAREETIVQQPARDQERGKKPTDEINPEEPGPLDDLGYRHIEEMPSAGPGMMFDEQDM